MKIALDYDGTYTRDPTLWNFFIGLCKASKHEVKIVTCRKPESEIDWFDLPEKFRVPVLYTSHIPKRIYCDEVGWTPTIWIDDMPETIVVCLSTELFNKKNGKTNGMENAAIPTQP